MFFALFECFARVGVLAADELLEVVRHGLEEVGLGAEQVDVVEVLVVGADFVAEV